MTFSPENPWSQNFLLSLSIKEFFCNSPKVAYRQGFELLINSHSITPFYTNKMPLNLKNSLAYFQKDAKSEERQQVIQCLNLFCKLKQEVTIKSGRKEGMILTAPSNSSVMLWLISKGLVCVSDCGRRWAGKRNESPVLRCLGEEGPVCNSEVLPLST